VATSNNCKCTDPIVKISLEKSNEVRQYEERFFRLLNRYEGDVQTCCVIPSEVRLEALSHQETLM
jgi:hypothetical protein